MVNYTFSEMEIDAIGEISNICLGIVCLDTQYAGAADGRYHAAESRDCREE